MKNILSYILMSLLLFNIMFFLCFYFKITSFFYLEVLNLSNSINFIIINCFVIIIDLVCIFFEKFIGYRKNYYFWYLIIGVAFGSFSCLVLLGKNSLMVSDYVSIISYFVINTIFIMYSLSFEKEKRKVFG